MAIPSLILDAVSGHLDQLERRMSGKEYSRERKLLVFQRENEDIWDIRGRSPMYVVKYLEECCRSYE